jgi:phosphoserine aminotransferase
VLGNGGTTCFWDAATFGLIEEQSQHLSFGEFSSKFAACAKAAPHLKDPQVIESEVGTHPVPVADPSVDLYALTHNETSTGVVHAHPAAQGGGPPGADGGGLVAVDATSGAGGLRVDPAEFDAYYLAPQKCFAGDGGLWIALMSPAALERVERIAASGRWIPTFLDLKTAVDNSVLDQTYNTPALATIFLLAEQLDWMNGNGGLEWTASRCDRSAEILYTWAEQSGFARPFVENPSTAATSSAPSTSSTRWTRRRSPRCCGRTASSTPSPTASSAATSCGSPCSRPSSPTTSPRCAPASTTWWVSPRTRPGHAGGPGR